MGKKKVYILIAVCLAALLFIGNAVKENYDYINSLETFHQQEMYEWISEQRGLARSLDRGMAEILSSSGEEIIKKALSDAYDTALEGRESLWGQSLIKEVNSSLDRWGLLYVYGDFSNYLYYLMNKGNSLYFTASEVQNLELIRSYAEILYKGFDDIIPHIQYEEELSSGMKTLNYYSWKKILNDRAIISKIDDMGHEINILSDIGGNDIGFKAYLDSRNNVSYLEYGLIHSGEEVLEEKILEEKAYLFFKDISGLNLIKASVSPDSQIGNTNESESGGSGYAASVDLIGDYYHYNTEDKEINVTYDMDLTGIGGHILNVRLNQENSVLSSIEDIIPTGEEIIKLWESCEGINLELTQSYISDSHKSATFGYAVVTDDVIVNSKTVTLYVTLGDNKAMGISIDARSYFDTYNYPLNYKPEINKAEAVEFLSPQLTATGEPKLEIKSDTFNLVYSIPVTGVKGVGRIYINAVTGAYEGMEYDYTNP